MAGLGAVIGLAAFAAVLLAAPTESATLFRVGTFLIGLGGGLFAVGTLSAVMAGADAASNGLALGAWGAVQATAAGIALTIGGAVRDTVGALATTGALGPALDTPAVGYGAVYHIEILLLFATLVALGPLAGPARTGAYADTLARGKQRLGLPQLPG
jgi:BCD family chlorophyll transporter-like MFS transporter